MPYHFYKAVLDCHIIGKIPFLPPTGIKKVGLILPRGIHSGAPPWRRLPPPGEP